MGIGRLFSPHRVILFLVFALGSGLRLLNLLNPPLDFHPTRQLRSAIIARGMYYSMSAQASQQDSTQAILLWNHMEILEPPILESLVALTYQMAGGETLWFARLYSILFWVAGGAALYCLARRITSPIGGLAAAAFYLLFPFGIYASRSFQPDPLMVLLLILAAYAALRWSEQSSWKWALLSGLLAGLTALVKLQAAPLLVGLLAALFLARLRASWSATARNLSFHLQNIAVMALFMLPPAIYYLLSTTDSTGWLDSWKTDWAPMLLQPSFYIRWLIQLDHWSGIWLMFIASWSAILLSGAARWMALGLWTGYGLLGVAFPYHILTHDYYNLPLIPLIGLSLAPLAELTYRHLAQQPAGWRWLASVFALLALAYPAWIARSTLVGQDYRPEAAGWQQIGQELPKDGPIIAIAHDYGLRLMYFGWAAVDTWAEPSSGSSQADALPITPEFTQYFLQKTGGYSYFLVTLTGDLQDQPALNAMLYEHYPLLEEQDYLLFDLRHPVNPLP